MKNSYSNLRKLLSSYWTAYGGIYALLKSPFFHLALVVTALSHNDWLHNEWWNQSIDILPNFIGFTLGGYAILLAFSDQRFLDLIRGNDDEDNVSLYMGLNSSFVHFLILQFLALLIALIFSSPPFNIVEEYAILHTSYPEIYAIVQYLLKLLNAFGYFLFIYSITAGIAATLSIFQVAKSYDKVIFPRKDNDE